MNLDDFNSKRTRLSLPKRSHVGLNATFRVWNINQKIQNCR
jgi:hypothetical protein